MREESSSETALLTPLQTLHSSTPKVIEEWLLGIKSLAVLSQEQGISPEALRKRIKAWTYSYSGNDYAYKQLRDAVLIHRLIEEEEKIDAAPDKVAVARARESLNHSRWLASTLIPDRFAQKQYLAVDKRVQVRVNRDAALPQQVVVEGQNGLVENTKGEGNQ
jgi:hypothetical protein